MATQQHTRSHVEAASHAAGLVLASAEPGTDFTGEPTTRYALSLPGRPGKTQLLELSDTLDLGQPSLQADFKTYLVQAAMRLQNPRPDCFVSLRGLPLSFQKFVWPFHASTSGADTFVLHGEIRLEDGTESPLHAKIAAALTVTFREIVPSMEQPFAEGFIYNAIRKTMDQGQLELVKSGNRQPVPVTTRYYSAKKKEFVFNDTTEHDRKTFLTAKVFWLSGVLGASEPVWLSDPRDAEYLNTTVTGLKETAASLVKEGLIHLAAQADFATPAAPLMQRHEQYTAEVAQTLQSIKPTFNEDMRGGHTNM